MATLVEVEARSLSFHSLQDARAWSVPTWLTAEVAPRPLWLLVSLLVLAYRQGALGVLASLEEWAAVLAVSRRTAARYQARAVELGLARILPTVAPSTATSRGRDRARNLVQLGPALLELVGAGLLEGLAAPTPSVAGARATRARQARTRARAYRRAAHGVAWTAQESRRGRRAPDKPAPVREIAQVATQNPAASPGCEVADPPPSVKMAPHPPPRPYGARGETVQAAPAARPASRTLERRRGLAPSSLPLSASPPPVVEGVRPRRAQRDEPSISGPWPAAKTVPRAHAPPTETAASGDASDPPTELG
jgi:hypothetical protein